MDKFLKPCAKRAADAVADARGTIAAAPPKRLKTGPTTFLYVKPSRDVVEVLEEAGHDGLLVDGRRLEVLGHYFG